MLDQIHGRAPFIGVGSIHTPDDAIKVLDSGTAFVAIGREIIMEPDWASKVQNGNFSEIRTTLSKSRGKALDIPEPLWNAIINTPGWFPLIE